MKTRKLGTSGLNVSALGLGCMRMSFADKPADKQEMMTLSATDLQPMAKAMAEIQVVGSRY